MRNLPMNRGTQSLCILLCVVALTLTAPATWAASPVGEWNLTMDMAGRTVEGTLKIVEEGDSLAGTWSGRRGEDALKDVKYEDGKLTFLRPVNYQGQEFELAYEGAIENDTLTGLFTTPMGDFEASGTRIVLASAAGDGIVGRWEITSDSQLGVLKREMVINDDLTGTYIGETGEFAIEDLKVDGNDVTFNVTVSVQDQELPLEFVGTLDGSALTGEFLMDGSAVADVTGTKLGATAGGAAGLTGTWNWVADSQLGVIESSFVVQDDGSATLASDGNEAEITDLKLDGDTLTFNVSVEVEGQAFDLTFEGKLDGDNITGEFSMEDIGPVADVTATRGGGGGLEAIAGDWNWVSDSQLGVIESKLVIQLDGSAILYNPGSDPVDLRDLSLDGNELTFAVSIDLEGQALDLEFEGTVDGDAIEGIYLMGDIGTVADIVGTRPGAGGLASMVGTWEITSESQLGTTDHTIVITEDGGLTFEAEGQEFTATEVAAEGTKLTFDVTLEIEGQEIPLSFEGTLDGADFAGEFLMEGASVAELTGGRAGSGLASLSGTWDITAETPLGTLEHTMTLTDDGTGTYLSDGESSDVTALSIDGSKVLFSVVVHADGGEYEVDFEGELDAGALHGNFFLDGGDVGSVTGKKQDSA